MTSYDTAGSDAGGRSLGDHVPQHFHSSEVQEQQQTGAAASKYAGSGGDTKSGINAGNSTSTSSSAETLLPALKIQHTGWLEGAENVAKELGKGAWTEITEHPGRVAESAAIGFGVGFASTLVAPEIAVAAGIGLGCVAIGELAVHAPKWIHDTKVVARPEKYTLSETLDAEEGVEALGGGAVDVTAGILGGAAGIKVGQMALFDSLRPGAVEKPVAKAPAQPQYDEAGRLTRIPAQAGYGRGNITYGPDGQVQEVNFLRPDGWRNIVSRQTGADGTSSWTLRGTNAELGTSYDPVPLKGTVALDADGKGITISDSSGVLDMRAEGQTVFTQSAEQLKEANQSDSFFDLVERKAD